MTDRERWTVYPLLFLTLGIAVKDRIVDTVQCSRLVVRDRQGTEQVVIAATPAGSALVVRDPKGVEQVIISATSAGGLVRAQGTKTGVNVVLGHTEEIAGLMLYDARGHFMGPGVVQIANIQRHTVRPHQGDTEGNDPEARPPEEVPPDVEPERNTNPPDEQEKQTEGEPSK
jgi:hypothetical protein